MARSSALYRAAEPYGTSIYLAYSSHSVYHGRFFARATEGLSGDGQRASEFHMASAKINISFVPRVNEIS